MCVCVGKERETCQSAVFHHCSKLNYRSSQLNYWILASLVFFSKEKRKKIPQLPGGSGLYKILPNWVAGLLLALILGIWGDQSPRYFLHTHLHTTFMYYWLLSCYPIANVVRFIPSSFSSPSVAARSNCIKAVITLWVCVCALRIITRFDRRLRKIERERKKKLSS